MCNLALPTEPDSTKCNKRGDYQGTSAIRGLGSQPGPLAMNISARLPEVRRRYRAMHAKGIKLRRINLLDTIPHTRE